MSNNNTLMNCRYCSVVSKTNNEDPIGSVGNFEQWLIIETALPWPEKIWIEPNPMSPEVVKLIGEMHAEGKKLRQLAIAPEREYSRPGYTRVFYYRRPAQLFAQFEKHEYIVADKQVSSLVTALLNQPEQLSKFEPNRQATNHIRELMVCTHGNFDVACARFGYPIYRQLRDRYACAEQLRVWRVSHFGGHQFAPTLIDLPTGQCWGHLEPKVLDSLIYRQGSVTALRPFYRGWAGLTKFEQIVEREIWMCQGWDWLSYPKAGKVLAKDIEETWAQVQIDFAEHETNVAGAYEARIEVSGQVTTAWWSSSPEDKEPLEVVKQYRVSHLNRVK